MKKQFPEWIKTLYRGIRAGVSAGIASVLILQINLNDPKEALKVVAVAFVSGFAVAFGKWAREYLDSQFGFDSNSIVAKAMPI